MFIIKKDVFKDILKGVVNFDDKELSNDNACTLIETLVLKIHSDFCNDEVLECRRLGFSIRNIPRLLETNLIKIPDEKERIKITQEVLSGIG